MLRNSRGRPGSGRGRGLRALYAQTLINSGLNPSASLCKKINYQKEGKYIQGHAKALFLPELWGQRGAEGGRRRPGSVSRAVFRCLLRYNNMRAKEKVVSWWHDDTPLGQYGLKGTPGWRILHDVFIIVFHCLPREIYCVPMSDCIFLRRKCEGDKGRISYS